MLEKLYILEFEEENVEKQRGTGKGSKKEIRMFNVLEVKRGE